MMINGKLYRAGKTYTAKAINSEALDDFVQKAVSKEHEERAVSGEPEKLCMYCVRKELVRVGVEIPKGIGREGLMKIYNENIAKVDVNNVRKKNEMTEDEIATLAEEYGERVRS